MKTKELSTIALQIALIAVVTITIAIPTPIGFVNLSDAFILVFALSSKNKFSAFLIGAIGCMFADLFLGYGQYAIFTFVIKGVEGLIVYMLKEKKPILSFLIAVIWMVIGYGITDVILAGSIGYFLPSAMYNSIQAGASVLLGLGFLTFFKKIFVKQE